MLLLPGCMKFMKLDDFQCHDVPTKLLQNWEICWKVERRGTHRQHDHIIRSSFNKGKKDEPTVEERSGVSISLAVYKNIVFETLLYPESFWKVNLQMTKHCGGSIRITNFQASNYFFLIDVMPYLWGYIIVGHIMKGCRAISLSWSFNRITCW